MPMPDTLDNLYRRRLSQPPQNEGAGYDLLSPPPSNKKKGMEENPLKQLSDAAALVSKALTSGGGSGIDEEISFLHDLLVIKANGESIMDMLSQSQQGYSPIPQSQEMTVEPEQYPTSPLAGWEARGSRAIPEPMIVRPGQPDYLPAY